MRRRLRYVELRSGFDGDGPAWIGWVALSKTGHTVYYRDRTLQQLAEGGTSSHRDAQTGEDFWIAGVKKGRHVAGSRHVVVDDDARAAYERIVGKPADSEA